MYIFNIYEWNVYYISMLVKRVQVWCFIICVPIFTFT